MRPDSSDPPAFSLEVTAGADGRSEVAVRGELDLATAAEFAAALRDSLAKGPVVLDLRELAFMDSAGVRALNDALRATDGSGHELRVRDGMQPAVAQVLELTGMIRLLRLEESA